METVERRKHSGRRHGRLKWVLLCLAALILCALAAVIMLNRAEKDPVPKKEDHSGAITQRKPEELESLQVTLRNGEQWTALREADGRLMILEENGTGESRWPADEILAERLTDAAVNLTYEEILTEDPEAWQHNQADFGLDAPLVTAAIRFTDGSGVTARIGNSADPHQDAIHYMAVEGDGRLYAVSAGTVEDLQVETRLLHAVPRLNIRGVLLDRITVRDGQGTRVSWELQGAVTDQDAAENWRITEPFDYPADYDAMKNLRTGAENLRLGAFEARAEAVDPADYGLGEDSLALEMHMAAGSTGTVSDAGVYDVTNWEEETVTLTVGSPKTEMVDYVLYDGAIYTMSHFSLGVFTETDAADTAARYVAATPLNALESLLAEEDGKEAVYYRLVRSEDAGTEGAGETAAGEGAQETESTRCLRNGEESPYATFAAAYERLLTVTVSGTLPEGYAPGEAYKKYTFRTVSGGTHTLELSDYDGIHDAVTMDGETRFYLIRGGMTELP